MSVNFRFGCDAGDPWNEVVFEDPLKKLMENVRGNAGKYVSVGKVCPEGIVY
jgi:hypothetical protein